MAEILIIYASRYGSTEQVARMLAEKMNADICSAEKFSGFDGYSFVLVGSGIYAHRFLPEMEQFIETNRGELLKVRHGMFGVAMKTETVTKNGRTFGGELILDKYGLSPVVKGMLHGRMDFSVLNEKDKSGLERFYVSIGLSEEAKKARRELRDMISDEEFALFAEKVMAAVI